MTIFQLFVFSCVRALSLDGDMMSMSCNWQPWPASYYATETLCRGAGERAAGLPIFSDIADGRKVERTRCAEIPVIDR